MHSILDTVTHLPNHRRVLSALIESCSRINGFSALFVSGSTATHTMDTHSDLDLGVVFDSDKTRTAAWEDRWDWQLEPWFHRFDADHIKPHFVIYLFNPCVKADINLYTADDLPSWKGAPFEIIFDPKGRLESWCETSNARAIKESGSVPSPSTSELDHDDERVWAWLIYCAQHVQRDEYYSVLSGFRDIRTVLERWSADLQGEPSFEVRRLETRWPDNRVAELSALFTSATRENLKALLIHTAALHSDQRERARKKYGVTWTTSDDAIGHIVQILQSI
jgi:hypothetical protein